MNLVEQLLDAVLAGDRFVVQELELRDALEAETRPNLPPEERRGALEGAPAVLSRRAGVTRGAERGVEDARELQVRTDLDARQRHETDARVVHVTREQQRELRADLVGDTVGPGALAHQLRNSTSVRVIRPGSTRSISSAAAASSRSACAWSVLTVTTASAARCQRSWCSTSETATLNFFSRSFTRRRTIRLSFSDCDPGT